jgi:serine/threonine-protein kinase
MAGRLPYEAASLTDLARLQETGPPPRLQDASRDVPPTLAAAVARALARDPERRYADAAEMEDALRDGLAGIANTDDLDATHHLPDDDSTRMLPPTAATGPIRPRRQLQPIDEPPARRTSTGRPAPARRQPPQKKQKGGGPGKWIALLLVLALIAGGVVAYQAISGATAKSVELNEDVGGRVDEAVQSFKDLVENNTR